MKRVNPDCAMCNHAIKEERIKDDRFAGPICQSCKTMLDPHWTTQSHTVFTKGRDPVVYLREKND